MVVLGNPPYKEWSHRQGWARKLEEFPTAQVTGKRRIPFRQLADAETGVLKVRVDATSGHGARFGSWSPSTAAAFIVLQSRFSGLCPRCRSA
jgi:hypothetical protein